jgi:hypothetical protein
MNRESGIEARAGRHASSIEIRRFDLGDATDRRRGLIAFITLLVDGRWRIDVTVRRTRAGRHALSFPARRDCDGRSRLVAGPADAATRREVERYVLAELGFSDEPPASQRESDGAEHG